jgi:hypothetical protein
MTMVMRHSTPGRRNPARRAPGKTTEMQVYDHWQAIRRSSYWWNGEAGNNGPLMAVARRFRLPIRELRVIIAAERDRRHP